MSQGSQGSGLKASLKNPRVSDEAKESAQERLDKLSQSSNTSSGRGRSGSSGQDPIDKRVNQGKDEGNVLRGYKASMHNPNVSVEAKEHSRKILEKHGSL